MVFFGSIHSIYLFSWIVIHDYFSVSMTIIPDHPSLLNDHKLISGMSAMNDGWLSMIGDPEKYQSPH